jgi:hypothetical protein
MPLKQNNREFVAFMMKLRGGLNTFTIHDFTRPLPKGTMRGSPTLGSAVTAGDSTLTIDAGISQAGKTLLAGDWLGLGGQLLMVSENVTFDGAGVADVDVEPPVRVDVISGTSVVYNKPTCEFKSEGVDAGFDALNVDYVGGITIDAMEHL